MYMYKVLRSEGTGYYHNWSVVELKEETVEKIKKELKEGKLVEFSLCERKGSVPYSGSPTMEHWVLTCSNEIEKVLLKKVDNDIVRITVIEWGKAFSVDCPRKWGEEEWATSYDEFDITEHGTKYELIERNYLKGYLNGITMVPETGEDLELILNCKIFAWE